jgi:hypothetical protein
MMCLIVAQSLFFRTAHRSDWRVFLFNKKEREREIETL